VSNPLTWVSQMQARRRAEIAAAQEIIAAGPRVRIVVWQQLVLGLVVFGYYLWANHFHSHDRKVAADRHGRWIYDLEHRLHIDPEVRLNAWLSHHHGLAIAANYEYAFMYILSALATLGFLLWRHPEVWRRARTSFIITTVVGVTCFWLFPTTPPRMLPGNHFVDTVRTLHTWGSWGSPMVHGANELAAMPSLHMAWALWVSVALAWAGVPRWMRSLTMAHVLITLYVILATANHYLLDALAAVVLVIAADRIALWLHPYWEGALVPSADAFFLHVEDAGDPQIVGGLVFYADAGVHPTREEIRDLVETELGELPRFRQRVSQPSRWRRARWVTAPPLDWDWHVLDMAVADRQSVYDAVAELTSTPMPRDRPMWRIATFTMTSGPEAGRRAWVLLMHHTISDGIGTVLQAMHLLRPAVTLPTPPRSPSALAVAGATAVGLAQLATDRADPTPLGTSSEPGSRHLFAAAGLPMEDLKAASVGRRVTDVVIALTVGAIADAHPELLAPSGGTLRVAVPLMVRDPSTTQEGNATAAVMFDVPFHAGPTDQLAAEISTRTAPLRTPTRALASRWVMAHALRIFPEPFVGWFARTVYGGRFFHGIVSNMPGPTQQLSMAGVNLDEVYPVLPLAPRAPFVLGGLSWNGVLGLGLATDPALMDASAITAGMRRRLAEMTGAQAGGETDSGIVSVS
jgi:diacylglycerol O-acyltransferase / wax synthase